MASSSRAALQLVWSELQSHPAGLSRKVTGVGRGQRALNICHTLVKDRQLGLGSLIL